MTTGELIKAARKSAGLTQAQLSEKSGVAAISIHQYEAGKRQPRLEQLLLIAKALRTTVSELAGPGYWSNLSPEEREGMWKSAPPPQISTDVQNRITAALGKLNDAGMEKAADAVEIIAEVPRYQAPQRPSQALSPAPEGKDTTPGQKPSERPPEGGDGES